MTVTIRWRPIITVPAVSPNWSATWDSGAPSTYRRLLSSDSGAERYLATTFAGADVEDADTPHEQYMQQFVAVSGLPEGVLRGFFRSVWPADVFNTNVGVDRHLRVIARVFDATGTVSRGVVFDGVSSLVDTTSDVYRQVGGDLTGNVVVQAGDILVVEVGGYIGFYTHNNNHALRIEGYNASAAYADFPYADGVVTEERSAWVEIETLPPPEPLIWGESGISYEVGVDQGVLYPPDSEGVPWDGLTTVTEQTEVELNPLYYDGVKYADGQSLGDYAATIRAFSYPPELEDLYRFGISYRTGEGRYIHLVYNVTARPTTKVYQTVSSKIEIGDFEWSLTAVPVLLNAFRATGHFIIDTETLTQTQLAHLENTLYGSATTEPYLPSVDELAIIVQVEGEWSFTHNGNGVWTATGSDELYTNLGSGRHELREVDAVLLGSGRYSIPV